nr:MAG TPA: hypothetical protein [Bacteriophage sp.]
MSDSSLRYSYSIEMLGLTCNIGYKGRIRPLPPIMTSYQ